ncbi:uncharacterized protein LOC128396450 [Panonychus citri]|uniref:uncharacterized protein LOC128396450 n=1 Tax=Panonychus citri TaxID=50023 RepID=UPI00230784B1|nr:uncharacterized protein LOC128396450 [Panonychus citri]
MDRITSLYSRLTKTHFIGIGVTLLLATAICVGVLVTRRSGSSSTLSPSFQHFKEKLAKIDHAVQWVKYNSENVTLTNAFDGGSDEDSSLIYACRAHHKSSITTVSEVIPGTYYPKTQKCKFTYGGKALEKDEFELLTTKDSSALIWLKNSNGEVYNGAITAGLTTTHDELTVARVEIYGFYYSIGKIHDVYKLAYVPDGKTEYPSHDYDVLCLKDFAL